MSAFSTPRPTQGSRRLARKRAGPINLGDRDEHMRDVTTDNPGGRKGTSKTGTHRPRSTGNASQRPARAPMVNIKPSTLENIHGHFFDLTFTLLNYLSTLMPRLRFALFFSFLSLPLYMFVPSTHLIICAYLALSSLHRRFTRLP